MVGPVRVTVYQLSWIRHALGRNCLGYELSGIRVVLGTNCHGYELAWTQGDQGTSWFGYELSWVRVVFGRVVLGTSCLGYELSWVRVDFGTSCPGYELCWARVVLGTSCFGYELSRSHIYKAPWVAKQDDWFSKTCLLLNKKHTNQCYVCRLAFRICFKDKIACSAVIDYAWLVPRYAINIYVVISTS